MRPEVVQVVAYQFLSLLAAIGGAAILAAVVLGTATEFLAARMWKDLPTRFSLRTLLIVIALGPVVLACGWWLYRQSLPDTFVHGNYVAPKR